MKVWYIFGQNKNTGSSGVSNWLSAFADTHDDIACRFIIRKEDILQTVPGKGDVIVITSEPDPNIMTQDVLEKIMLHVLDGGHILFAGRGTWIKSPYELCMMQGAGLMRSMPYAQLTIEYCDGIGDGAENQGADDLPEHKISDARQGMETDVVVQEEFWDELWVFERSVFDDAKVLAQVRIGKMTYPVIWTRNWHYGKVHSIALGMQDLSQKGYREVLDHKLEKMLG